MAVALVLSASGLPLALVQSRVPVGVAVVHSGPPAKFDQGQGSKS